MSNVKELITKIIQEQPDDASYEEILRELVLERMIDQGLEDSRKGRLVSNEDGRRNKHSFVMQPRQYLNLRGSCKSLLFVTLNLFQGLLTYCFY